MVCTVLIWFILTVLQESSNLDAIFIVCRKIKNKIIKLVFSPTPPPFWSKANFLIFFNPSLSPPFMFFPSLLRFNHLGVNTPSVAPRLRTIPQSSFMDTQLLSTQSSKPTPKKTYPRMAGKPAKTIVRKDFLKKDEKTKIQDALNDTKDAKDARDKKKEVREQTKANKDIFDNIIAENKNAAERMEEQIDKIGDKITSSVGNEIANLSRILTQFMIRQDKPHDPATGQNRQEKPTEEQQMDHDAQDIPSQESQDQPSLPCAQSRFRIMTQNSQSSQIEEPNKTEEEENRWMKYEQILDQLTQRIETLEAQITNNKTRENQNQEPLFQNQPYQEQPQTYAAKASLVPALKIDLEGNQDKNEIP